MKSGMPQGELGRWLHDEYTGIAWEQLMIWSPRRGGESMEMMGCDERVGRDEVGDGSMSDARQSIREARGNMEHSFRPRSDRPVSILYRGFSCLTKHWHGRKISHTTRHRPHLSAASSLVWSSFCEHRQVFV